MWTSCFCDVNSGLVAHLVRGFGFDDLQKDDLQKRDVPLPLQPVRYMAKNQATVGALRAQPVGVDPSLKSQGGLHARNDNGIVTAAQVAT
jgi:hypothetical protein